MISGADNRTGGRLRDLAEAIGRFVARSPIAITLVLAAILALLAIRLGLLACTAELQIEMQSPQAQILQVFWAGKDLGPYQEKRSSKRPFKPGRHRVSLSLPNLALVDRIRIDPLIGPGKVLLRDVRLTQPGMRTIRLTGPDSSANIHASNDVSELKATAEGTWVLSGGIRINRNP